MTSVIALEQIEIATLPFLPLLSERRRLPNVAACYLVLEGETVIYVGRSKNLYSRWRNYHQKGKDLRSRSTQLKIAWIECSNPSLIPALETALIEYFQPELNGKKTKQERAFIQVPINLEDKADFDAWCEANSTTMSEVVRKAIAPYILKGSELRQQSAAS